MKRFFTGAGGVAAALLLAGSAASAAELQFTVDFHSSVPGVVETFDVDTAVAGTPSADGSGFANFQITDDNLGHSVLLVSDPAKKKDFGTGTSDADAGEEPQTFTGRTSQTFFDGSSYFLQATPGEMATGNNGTTIQIAAAPGGGGGGGPEPSTWALMMVGVFGAGAALRRHQSLSLRAA